MQQCIECAVSLSQCSMLCSMTATFVAVMFWSHCVENRPVDQVIDEAEPGGSLRMGEQSVNSHPPCYRNFFVLILEYWSFFTVDFNYIKHPAWNTSCGIFKSQNCTYHFKGTTLYQLQTIGLYDWNGDNFNKKMFSPKFVFIDQT